jgi:dipeptidyl aminopeptidase/acylaminoacyl peptidase
MLSKSDLISFTPNYWVLLRELLAAALAALVLAFFIVALWLVAYPSRDVVLAMFAILGGTLLLSYLAVRFMLYPPRSQPQSTPADFGIARWEDAQFRAGDGIALGAWFVPPSAAADGATIIFLHGQSANRSELLREAAMLTAHGYGALLLDVRNHGRSGSAVTTFGYREVEDVRGAITWLLTRPEVNGERLGVFGHSMGGVIALRAAARMPRLRAVVAQNTFTSLEENIETGVIVQLGLPPFPFAPLVVWLGERITGLRVKQVRPIDDVAQISPRAVLLIHGRQDSNVSPDNSRRLYAAAYEPKSLYIVEQAGHADLMQANPAEYEKRVVTFFERNLRGQRPPRRLV